MSRNLEPTAFFTIEPSASLRLVVGGLYALALSACWLNSLPAPVKLILSALLCWDGWRYWQATRARVTYLRYTPEQGWALRRCDGDFQPIAISAATVVNRLLIVLQWQRNDNSQGQLVIFNDALSPPDYRRLSVCLKISGYGQTA